MDLHFFIDFTSEGTLLTSVTRQLSGFSETGLPSLRCPPAAEDTVRHCLLAEDLLFNHFMVA